MQIIVKDLKKKDVKKDKKKEPFTIKKTYEPLKNRLSIDFIERLLDKASLTPLKHLKFQY